MNIFRRLYSFEDDVDFRKGWRIAFAISAILLVLGVFSLGARGLELGIDFKGGTSWQFPVGSTSTTTVRNALSKAGAPDARIQTLNSGADARFLIEVGTEVNPDKAVAALAKATGQSKESIVANQNEVGPSWGANVSRSAIRALIVFFIVVAIYISWQLEWRMAVGALVAVIHDVFLSIAVYAIFRFEVTPGTVIAFLTILGYSLYDTIVVYDKVRDNQGHLTLGGDMTYTDMMNLSLNQTFMRSINTTLSAVLPVASILFIGAGVLGAVTLEEFGLALFVGLILGAYSSVFIASPIVAFLKEREPRNAQIRKQVLARRSGNANDVATQDDVNAVDGRVPVVESSALQSMPSPYSDKHPPRPRKLGKKR